MMKYWRKKLLVIILAGSMALSGSPGVSSAAKPAESQKGKSEAALLEQIKKAVLKKITIPKEMTSFYCQLKKDEETVSPVTLNWLDKKHKRSISIRTDKQGHIFYYWDDTAQPDSNKNNVPKFSRDDLQAKAEAFISKVSPEMGRKLSLTDSRFDGMTSGTCSFEWTRTENGVPFPQNTVNIRINAVTGKVLFYYTEWYYGLYIPKEKEALTKAQARKKMESAMKMTLVYLGQPISQSPAILVYKPSFITMAADAVTGDIYDSDSEYILNPAAPKNFCAPARSIEEIGLEPVASASAVNVEPSGITGILTEEEAVAAVKNEKLLLMPEGKCEITATLYKNDFPPLYEWEILFKWRAAGEDAFSIAVIDASNGHVEFFHSFGKEAPAKTEVSVNREDGRCTIEDFAKRHSPERYSDVIYNKQAGGTSEDTYYYQFDRYYNGIPVEGEGIFGKIDPSTGRIVYFGSFFSCNEFESPDNIIPPEEALKCWLDNMCFIKMYEMGELDSASPKVRLVYRFISSHAAYVYAKTGKLKKYSG